MYSRYQRPYVSLDKIACATCNGSGKIRLRNGTRCSCDVCDGTGIKGSAELGFRIAAIVSVFFWSAVALILIRTL